MKSGDQKLRPLRIIIGCDTFKPNINGAARFAERLAAELVRRGHEVYVVAPSASRSEVGKFTETVEGIDLIVHRLPSVRYSVHEWLRFVWPWRINGLVSEIIDEVRPDVIHFQSHIVVGRGLSKVARARNIRLVATNHIMAENIIEFIPIPKFMRKIFLAWAWQDADKILARADVVTTPTERAAKMLENVTRQRSVRAISCGIKLADYTADFTERAEKRIVFVGRVTHEKQIHVLVRALKKLPDSVCLDIVGCGAQTEELQQLAQQLGVSSRIVWHGAVSNAQLRSTLTRSSVFAIASTAELQSIATLEAMASGLPIVAANAMALPHLVTEGENGFLFEPRCATDLAHKITRVLEQDSASFTKMQRASLATAAKHDIDLTVSAFERIYRGDTTPGL
ncbi:glycosyltransferase [Canibacter sp. lx-72]|uniref:glycosyltransferase n=1 Tax=Canibacter zhuwentaonis TaxID=2837491 RepID=UPI001BDD222A|nr:glycosyltransferase [Canibacter zhuwentaonis]MBT1018703.1 glycosyltransferase [Canibacter zhuwentaonis]